MILEVVVHWGSYTVASKWGVVADAQIAIMLPSRHPRFMFNLLYINSQHIQPTRDAESDFVNSKWPSRDFICEFWLYAAHLVYRTCMNIAMVVLYIVFSNRVPLDMCLTYLHVILCCIHRRFNFGLEWLCTIADEDFGGRSSYLWHEEIIASNIIPPFMT